MKKGSKKLDYDKQIAKQSSNRLDIYQLCVCSNLGLEDLVEDKYYYKNLSILDHTKDNQIESEHVKYSTSIKPYIETQDKMLNLRDQYSDIINNLSNQFQDNESRQSSPTKDKSSHRKQSHISYDQQESVNTFATNNINSKITNQRLQPDNFNINMDSKLIDNNQMDLDKNNSKASSLSAMINRSVIKETKISRDF